MRIVVTVVVCALVAGCSALSGKPPVATPADFAGVVANLARRGVTIERVVSGDAGCSDQALARTAISFLASGAGQTAPTKVYLFSFADKEAFERLRPAIDDCARSFVTDASTFESIDALPFVAAGQGPWTQGFRSALRSGLEEAAQQGG
jgi:hypothetical protein